MKLYRTVSVKEFVKIMFGEKIEGYVQKGIGCHYFNEEHNSMITASQEPKAFVCTFNENIFWYTDDKEILLTLEIPESRIVTTGFGEYSTMIWDKFIEGDSLFCYGQFGMKRRYRNGVEFGIKETYIEYYTISDIVNVEFIYETTLPTFGIESNEIKFHAFDVYDAIRSYLLRYGRKEKVQILKFKYYDSNLWNYNSEVSLSMLKLVLKKEIEKLPNLFDKNSLLNFMDKWHYYKDVKILEKVLLKPQYLKTAFSKTLDFHQVYNTLLEVFEFDGIYHFEGLYEIETKDMTKFNVCWKNFCQHLKLKFNKTLKETWDINISQKYLYSMLKIADLI